MLSLPSQKERCVLLHEMRTVRQCSEHRLRRTVPPLPPSLPGPPDCHQSWKNHVLRHLCRLLCGPGTTHSAAVINKRSTYRYEKAFYLPVSIRCHSLTFALAERLRSTSNGSLGRRRQRFDHCRHHIPRLRVACSTDWRYGPCGTYFGGRSAVCTTIR